MQHDPEKYVLLRKTNLVTAALLALVLAIFITLTIVDDGPSHSVRCAQLSTYVLCFYLSWSSIAVMWSSRVSFRPCFKLWNCVVRTACNDAISVSVKALPQGVNAQKFGFKIHLCSGAGDRSGWQHCLGLLGACCGGCCPSTTTSCMGTGSGSLLAHLLPT